MNFLRPSKHDIYQIEKFAALGVSRDDIAELLNIAPVRLAKWEESNAEISSYLKPKARPEFTIVHPDYAHMVEEAFTCAGKRFYRFKEEYRMSTGRYKYYYATLRELELKLDSATLTKYLDAIEKILNGGSKGKVEMGKIWEMIFNMRTRVELEFDPKTIKDLAAIAYFDESEDLTTYDQKHGQAKIKLWESHGNYDFFLTKPIGELFGLKNSSVEHLQQFLSRADGIIQELNSNLQAVLEDNSLETGNSTSSD